MSTDGAGKGDETELSPLNSTQVSAKTLNVPKETEEGKEETKTGKGKAEGGPTSSEEPPKNAPRMTSYQRVLSKAKDVSKRFSLSPSKAQQDDVSDQTALFNEKGTIWEAVKSGNIDAARAMCKQKPKLLNERGPVGENPLHLCFLFNMPTQLQLAKDLLTEHPEYLDAIYENDTYHGETYLHIAIVNKDLGMVEWLLEKKPELLYMRADGIFFSPSKKGVTCYYGEYPLAFAVSTNNFPMFEFLMSKDPLQFWQQDSQGNTILHMCITYDLEEMYSYILKMEPELRRKLEEEKKAAKVPKWTLETARNHDGYTPLTYSTQTKEPGKMTVFVINSQKQTQWSYGPVSCNIYPLEEADTIAAKRKAATWGSDDNESHDVFKDKNGKPLKAPTSALDLIIQGAALEVLMSDYFKDLLHKKWTAYAGNAFYMRCFRTTLFILALTLAQLMGFPSFDVYSQDSNASTGVLVGRFITDLLVIVGLLIKGHTELGELYESGWSYFNQTGSAFLENNLSFSLLFSLPLSMLLENLNSETAQLAGKFFVSLSILIAWSYTFALLLGFKLTGPFVIMIWKMMVSDVLRFTLIFLVLLFGFASAFTAVLDTSDFDGVAEYFSNYWEYLHTLFMVMLGDVDFEGFNEGTVPQYRWWNSLLLLVYVMVMTIALLNLLIAMMGDTYADIKESADSAWHFAYAQIIMSVEEELNFQKYFARYPEAQYWIMVDDKPYLQVMEVNTNYYDAIRSEASLKSMDTNNDGEVSVEELRVGLMKMSAESRDNLLRDLGLESYSYGKKSDPRRKTMFEGIGPEGPKNQVDSGNL